MTKEIEIPSGYEARIEGNKVIFEPMNEDAETRRLIRVAINKWFNSDGMVYEKDSMEEMKNRCLAYLEKQKEQKHAEWSEEDKKVMDNIIFSAEHHCYLNPEETQWLKSIRPQPKQEWSEEDVEKLAKNRMSKSGTLKSEMSFYRQGVRDAFNYKGMRSHWKPSEEQLSILGKVFAGCELNTTERDSMVDLFYNLKQML